jgi:anti-sigma factor RsiW
MNGQFSCSAKETLIAYVYGECDSADREAVEAHMTACAACADEVAGLGGVRRALAEWAPPDIARGFRIVRDETATAVPDTGATVLRPARWWRRPLPAWASAAAAVLLFAAGAGLANLDVHYGPDGLTIRTGWQHTRDTASPAAVAQTVPAAGPSPASAPWRSDLVALERQLRGDFGAQLQAVRSSAEPQRTTAPAAGVDERQLMTRVRALIDESVGESEQRQQREFASRVAQVQGEWGAQRQADLVRLQQGLGWVQGQTGAEVAQQRRLINYLLTVSQKK